MATDGSYELTAAPTYEPTTTGDSPTPARPNDVYVGSCANDFYGTFEVVADGEGMALVEGPDRVTFPLTHWDADTFTYIGSPEYRELPVLGEIAASPAVLIPPDGHVAWAGDLTASELPRALASWFGAAAPAR